MTLTDLHGYVDDRIDEGVFRVHRDVYTDPALFALEQRFIFERTWSFIGLESQIPRAHDYITGHIGRTPILLARNAQGGIGGFINACRHKGAQLACMEAGNAKMHVCPYHGWAYGSDGRNVDVKDKKTAHYAPAFDAEHHDLLPIARVESYKGLVFGSLSADVPLLKEFLGEMAFFLDLVAEQSPQGMEFVPGRAVYTYNANWKLQMDNGMDPYHLTSTHQSYMNLQARRRAGQGNLEARQFDWQRRAAAEGGVFGFDHGHSVFWMNQPEPEKRPVYARLAEVTARVGAVKAEWMVKARNFTVFPNMQIADSISLMLRTFRPLAVDRTEMRSFCLAPIGEDADVRAWRLRQFEDFFNPSGMATPDDTIVYEECQAGLNAQPLSFLQGYSRGIAALQSGANDVARSIGIAPQASTAGTFESQFETTFHPSYREWARLMQAGLAGNKAYA